MEWLLLLVAIVAEVIATSALKSAKGFTRLWPSLIVICCYSLALYLLSLTLETIPVGVVYAVSSQELESRWSPWSGATSSGKSWIGRLWLASA